MLCVEQTHRHLIRLYNCLYTKWETNIKLLEKVHSSHCATLFNFLLRTIHFFVSNKQTKDKIILAKKEIVGFFSKYTILNE